MKNYFFKINEEKISIFIFFLIFSFLFFYRFGIGLRVIPPVIGSGISIFMLIALLFLLPSLLIKCVDLRGGALVLFLLWVSLVAYAGMWAASHYFFGDFFSSRWDVVIRCLSTIAGWLAFFVLGFFWPKKMSNKCVIFLVFSLVGMALIVFLNVMETKVMSFDSYDGDNNEGYSYQGFSRSVAFVGLVLFACTIYSRGFFIVSFLVIATIFLIGSRSELVGIVPVFFIVIYLRTKLNFEKIFSSMRNLSFLSIIILLFYALYFFGVDSRQFEIFDIFESSSGLARLEMQRIALQDIMANPLFGNFAGDVRRYGNVGGYAHNIISMWRQFGVIGFVIYVSLLISSLVMTGKGVLAKPNRKDERQMIAFLFSVFFLILLLTSKTAFWPFPALSWGLAVACYKDRHVIHQ